MRYRTVFDFSQTAPIDWRIATICLILVLAGIAAVVLRNKFAVWAFWPKSTRRLAAPFAVLFLLVTVAISASIFWLLIKGRNDLLAKSDSSAKVVEGPVHQFVPAPYVGHADESFCVREKCFSYSDYEVTGGFNRTRSHGGPIREGLPVRVTYVGDLITKLEVGVDDQ
jgi:hypothetical protein